MSEIRSRTQGDTENITFYLAIMDGMFLRLSKKLSDEEKLEILLHNVRPHYATILAAAFLIIKIVTFDTVRRIITTTLTVNFLISANLRCPLHRH